MTAIKALSHCVYTPLADPGAQLSGLLYSAPITFRLCCYSLPGRFVIICVPDRLFTDLVFPGFLFYFYCTGSILPCG